MKILIKGFKFSSIFIVLLSLTGCWQKMALNAQPNDPAYAPTYPKVVRQMPNYSGSIYQYDNDMASLFNDLRARRIGDIITINLIEATTAQKAAQTDTAKTTSVNVQNPVMLGRAVKPDFSVGLESDNSFSGNGSSSQNNTLQGSISVTVSDKLPNGNLEVLGEKWITLNQGSEYIRISGIVRPVDIDENNTVLSTQVANARITYSGTGALTNSNREGWLSRFFNGPLWPF